MKRITVVSCALILGSLLISTVAAADQPGNLLYSEYNVALPDAVPDCLSISGYTEGALGYVIVDNGCEAEVVVSPHYGSGSEETDAYYIFTVSARDHLVRSSAEMSDGYLDTWRWELGGAQPTSGRIELDYTRKTYDDDYSEECDLQPGLPLGCAVSSPVGVGGGGVLGSIVGFALGLIVIWRRELASRCDGGGGGQR